MCKSTARLLSAQCHAAAAAAAQRKIISEITGLAACSICLMTYSRTVIVLLVSKCQVCSVTAMPLFLWASWSVEEAQIALLSASEW